MYTVCVRGGEGKNYLTLFKLTAHEIIFVFQNILETTVPEKIICEMLLYSSVYYSLLTVSFSVIPQNFRSAVLLPEMWTLQKSGILCMEYNSVPEVETFCAPTTFT